MLTFPVNTNAQNGMELSPESPSPEKKKMLTKRKSKPKKISLDVRSGLEFNDFLRDGFEVRKINYDLDNFTVSVKFNAFLDSNPDLERLTIHSLMLYFRLLSNSEELSIQQQYCLVLSKTPKHRNRFNIEINYLNTDSHLIFIEAYCYNDIEELVAKGGFVIDTE